MHETSASRERCKDGVQSVLGAVFVSARQKRGSDFIRPHHQSETQIKYLTFAIPLAFLLASPASAAWKLVKADEFNGPAGSQPDPALFNYQLGTGGNTGWGGDELQCYTDRPKNVAEDGQGHLVITAYLEDFTAHDGRCVYTSAALTTKRKFSQRYGAWEIRFKYDGAQGASPAYWLEPDDWHCCKTDAAHRQWSYSGEIDGD